MNKQYILMNLKKSNKVLSIHFTNVNILFHSISKYSIKYNIY